MDNANLIMKTNANKIQKEIVRQWIYRIRREMTNKKINSIYEAERWRMFYECNWSRKHL